MGLPSLPSGEAIVKGVIITAIAVVIINFAKPFLPAPVSNLLTLK